MWKKLSKKKKALLIIAVVIIIVLFAAPIIAKNYINNNGKELIGRKIHISSLGVNYFTASINIKDIVVYEPNEKDTLLYAGKIHVNPNLLACLRSKYIIQNVEIDKLNVNTILTDSSLNFDDIIAHFSDTTDTIEVDTTPVFFSLEKITLTNSKATYKDNNINSFVALQNINIKTLEEFSTTTNTLNADANFNFKSGGKVAYTINLNTETGDYTSRVNSSNVNLNILLPYFKDFLSVSDFMGELNTNLTFKGTSQHPDNIHLTGDASLQKMKLIDSLKNEVVGVNNLAINIDSVDVENEIFNFKSVHIDLPFTRYEVYKNSDNFSRMLRASSVTEVDITESDFESSNVFIFLKDYIVEALAEIKNSKFAIDTIDVNDIKLRYIDNAMAQKFDYTISNGDITAYNLKSTSTDLNVTLNALLNNKGKLIGKALLHPTSPEDLAVNIEISEVDMKDVSPYFYQYFAIPITKGIFNMTSDINVTNKQLNNTNNLLAKAFKLGKKQQNEEAYNLPIKMAVAMLKDRNGDIPLDIEVKGDLSDPKYNVWKVVGQILKEIIVKAATSPYNAIANGLNTDEESTKQINMSNSVVALTEKQLNKLDKFSEVLLSKPQLTLLVNPYYNAENESKSLALFLTKAKFLGINKDSLTTEDIDKINALNSKDSLFVNYLNKKSKTENLNLKAEEKALKLFEKSELNSLIKTQIDKKLYFIYSYLINKGVKPNQITNIISTENTKYENTKTDKVYFSLMFDVVDDITNEVVN